MTRHKAEAARRRDHLLSERASKTYFALLRTVVQGCNLDGKDDLLKAIRSKDFVRLVEAADYLSAQKYTDAATHYAANQIASLIRKYPYPGCEDFFQPEAKAYATFCKSEHKCARVNSWFRARRLTRRFPCESELNSMRSFIRYVLSDEPNLQSILDETGFGPGASIGVSGNATNFGRKLTADSWTVSPGAYIYGYWAIMRHAQVREALLPEHLGFTSGSAAFDFEQYTARTKVVDYNRLCFVPKTVKTHRSIAVEPLVTGFIQKGIDNTMRRLLKRVGIDLSDQKPNSIMARQGSLEDTDDGFVTIDLSSASDSISIELCREILPPAWFELLDSTRSKNYEYKGRIKRFSKFCSMGNGFCFPLETLIFAAACNAVNAGNAGKDFRVYGDDIVVRKRFARPLIALLERLGFATNRTKTFLEGPFRESCGEDWFGGEDVRPFILDRPLDSIQEIFKFWNLTASKELWRHFFGEARADLLRLIPESLQLWRPFTGAPDSGLDSSGFEHLTSSNCHYRFKHGNGVWIWTELLVEAAIDKRPSQARHGTAAMIFAALSGADSRKPFTFRLKYRSKFTIKSGMGATSQWLPSM